MSKETDAIKPAAHGDKQDLAAIWERFVQTRDVNLRDQLIEHYMPLVWQNATRLAQRLPSHIHIDDLVNAGILGLIDAINRFDPGRHVEFAVYGSRRICGAIYDELRAWDWLPRRMRRRASELESARNDLTASLGRSPSAEELAEALAISPEEVAKIQQSIQEQTSASLDMEMGIGESAKTAGDFIADTGAVDPLKEAARLSLIHI